MMVRYHMHGNLDVLRAIERLLIRGSLDDARSLARSVAEAPIEPDLGSWAARAATIRDRAAAVASAPSLDEAVRREARLAEACADCHLDTRVQPELRSPPVPPDRDTLLARMARHRWAADRLWEGVIAADDAPWNAGLVVLSATPLRWPELGERISLARSLQRLADQARQRSATDTIADRARSYGEMLVVCTACHTAQATR
jgi:cytochrome c553